MPLPEPLHDLQSVVPRPRQSEQSIANGRLMPYRGAVVPVPYPKDVLPVPPQSVQSVTPLPPQDKHSALPVSPQRPQYGAPISLSMWITV